MTLREFIERADKWMEEEVPLMDDDTQEFIADQLDAINREVAEKGYVELPTLPDEVLDMPLRELIEACRSGKLRTH